MNPSRTGRMIEASSGIPVRIARAGHAQVAAAGNAALASAPAGANGPGTGHRPAMREAHMIGHISYPDTLVYRQQWKELQAEVTRDHAIDEYLGTGSRSRRTDGSRRRVVVALGVVLFIGTLVAVPWLNQRVFIAESPSGVETTLPAADQAPEPGAASGQGERRVARGVAPPAADGATEGTALDAES